MTGLEVITIKDSAEEKIQGATKPQALAPSCPASVIITGTRITPATVLLLNRIFRTEMCIRDRACGLAK